MGSGTMRSMVEEPRRYGFAAPPTHELRSQGGCMSYEAVPDTDLAAVVTYLEMRVPPDHHVPPSSLSLTRIEVPQPEHYRDLFRLIGAPWLWFSRLIMDDAHLASIIQHPK